MARLLGLVLPDDKRVDYALTLFYGIGWKNVQQVLEETGIKKETRVKALSEDDLKRIGTVIEKNFVVEGDLREKHNDDIKRLKEIGSYRGIRHIRGLPGKGQRTKSNARTRRGKRKTVGALKKEAWAKLEQTQNQAASATKK